MQEYIQLRDVSVVTATGRALFQGLNLGVGAERVAIVGRNGVGKSTLLELLAGERHPVAGRIWTRSTPFFVPQSDPTGSARSRGEVRRDALRDAQASGAEILLLDEPSEHLDERAVAWLRRWLCEWKGCALVASHDRRLLADFEDFFIVSESGCRHFHGSLPELEAHLEREHLATEQRYVRNLNRLATEEEHTDYVARRKARKKRYGRTRELDRNSPRISLNRKRGEAQVSHGRLAKLRAERLAALRDWTRSTRRAIGVSLSLDLGVPALPPASGVPIVALQSVSASRGARLLFEGIDLCLERERVAVVGENGAGKTTLFEIALGRQKPALGTAQSQPWRVGSIEQGGENWKLGESLLGLLGGMGFGSEAAAELLVAHKFPLGLAERPLLSLSSGERTRAALICLFARTPAVELLVLDEPTFSLDLVALRALTRTLQAWPGALLVASHDRAFLSEIGVDRTIELGRSGAGTGEPLAPPRVNGDAAAAL